MRWDEKRSQIPAGCLHAPFHSCGHTEFHGVPSLRGDGPLLPIRLVCPLIMATQTHVQSRPDGDCIPGNLGSSTQALGIETFLGYRAGSRDAGVASTKVRSAEAARLSTIVNRLKRAVWGTPGAVSGHPNLPRPAVDPWIGATGKRNQPMLLCSCGECLLGWLTVAVRRETQIGARGGFGPSNGSEACQLETAP
jgi:hypothetical protein